MEKSISDATAFSPALITLSRLSTIRKVHEL